MAVRAVAHDDILDRKDLGLRSGTIGIARATVTAHVATDAVGTGAAAATCVATTVVPTSLEK